MAHIHSVYDSDKHFSIDPVTRAITNESSTKNTVIQNDHNSERFTFELPRYIEGHDMSVCNRVEVHYININSAAQTESRGVYEVVDLRISPDDTNVVICSWLLSNSVTKYDGSLSFLLRFACTVGDVVSYAWHTAVFSGISVGKGIYNSEAAIAEYVDVLEQWKQQLFTINDDGVTNVTEAQTTAVTAIETAATAKTQEVLASIPDDYQTLAANVTAYMAKGDSLANAIKGNLFGPVVRADDVSPVEHGVSVKVRSKNLMDVTKITVQSGIDPYISFVDVGTVKITTGEGYAGNGHCQSYVALRDLCPQLAPGKQYVLSAVTDSTNKMVHLRGVDVFIYFGTPITITEEMLSATVGFYGLDARYDSTGVGTCVISNIQLEEGSTATEYTPYVDPASVTVTKCGKNLWPVFVTDQTYPKGSYVKVNADGSILLHVAGDNIRFDYMMNLPAGTYTMSNGEYTTTDNKPYIILYELGGDTHYCRETFTLEKQTECKLSVYAWYEYEGDFVFTPQLEVGDTVSDYESYGGSTYTPTTDGTVLDVTSLSPTMTLLTDKEGAVVECEYNRDTNAVIADLYGKIVALSAT